MESWMPITAWQQHVNNSIFHFLLLLTQFNPWYLQDNYIIQPDYAPAYAGLGEAYWRKYRTEREPQWLDLAANNTLRALELDSLLTAPRSILGLVRLAQGDLDAARSELDRSLVLDPSNAVALRGLGDLFVREGTMDQAEAHYRRAVAAAPEDQEVHGALGGYYYRLGRGGDAAVAFARSIELAPDYRADERHRVGEVPQTDQGRRL
jgi:tetratricopeptide (TPR) repeat protein